MGVRDTSFQSVMKCDVDIRRDFYAIVVLSGGTPTFQEIGVSMTKALTVLALPAMNVNGGGSVTAGVFDVDWRIYLVFPENLKVDVDLDSQQVGAAEEECEPLCTLHLCTVHACLTSLVHRPSRRIRVWLKCPTKQTSICHGSGASLNDASSGSVRSSSSPSTDPWQRQQPQNQQNCEQTWSRQQVLQNPCNY